MHIAVAFVIALFSHTGVHDVPVIVARPEVPNQNIVHVGQTLVVPLYDGQLAPQQQLRANGLRSVGKRRIARHDLLKDVGDRSAFGGYDAASERAEAFVVERPGRGSVNVLLRLPRLKYPCASCRTVHFYYRAT